LSPSRSSLVFHSPWWRRLTALQEPKFGPICLLFLNRCREWFHCLRIFSFLSLGKQTQRNVVRCRLYSHALRVKTRSWEHHDGTCDKCGLQAIQDEKHALIMCPCMQMCSLRLQFADLFHDLPLAHKNYCQSDWSFLFLPSLF